jgi:hypothetical protein
MIIGPKAENLKKIRGETKALVSITKKEANNR